MLIGMSKHELDSKEQQRDHRPPGEVVVGSIQVARGRAMPPGTWVEDADMGSVIIPVTPPADNFTPAGKMGYRIRHCGGNLPDPHMLPGFDVRAVAGTQGPPFLVLYWKDGATSSHPPIRFLLSVAAVDLGGNVGPCTYFAVCDPSVAPAVVDEIRYDPRALRIVNEGANGWLLTTGSSRMLMFDNEQDARNGLAVAQRYTREGFVGRSNHRMNREQYIFHYWAGSSGLPPAPLSRIDAIAYQPQNVFAHDLGAAGWRLQDGGSYLTLADNVSDALAQLRIVKQHNRICFVGRGNHRPNRDSYIMTYWE